MAHKVRDTTEQGFQLRTSTIRCTLGRPWCKAVGMKVKSIWENSPVAFKWLENRWHAKLTLRLFPSAMYCSAVCGLWTTQYPVGEEGMKFELNLQWKHKLTYWNCGRLNSRRGWQERCDFHLEHLRGYATVKLFHVFIVNLKQLAWNVIVLSVNVVGVDFGLTLDCGTVNGLRWWKIKFPKGPWLNEAWDLQLPAEVAAREFAVFLFLWWWNEQGYEW